jgi:hypothetical protein
MTFDEAQQKLIDCRNAALTKHGNYLLFEKGMTVDDEAFRKSMLRYAGALEVWRMSSLQDIARSIGAMTVQHSSVRH